jgi:hypothetical protein
MIRKVLVQPLLVQVLVVSTMSTSCRHVFVQQARQHLQVPQLFSYIYRTFTANMNRKNRKRKALQAKRLGGSASGGRTLNSNYILRLQICHSDSDIVLENRKLTGHSSSIPTMKTMPYDYKQIHKVIQKTFDTTYNLQYYHEIQHVWKAFPTNSMNGMGRYKRGHVPLNVRILDQYIAEEDDEEEDVMEDGTSTTTNVEATEYKYEYIMTYEDYDTMYGPDTKRYDDDYNVYVRYIKIILWKLVFLLHDTGYERVQVPPQSNDMEMTTTTTTTTSTTTSSSVVMNRRSNTTCTSKNSSSSTDTLFLQRRDTALSTNHPQQSRRRRTIATKTWVLQQASRSMTLQSILLQHVGILDHIVFALHTDSVWKVNAVRILSEAKQLKELQKERSVKRLIRRHSHQEEAESYLFRE